MTGIKAGDIVLTKDGWHAKVIDSIGRQQWAVEPIESWAKTRRTVKSRQVAAIYRRLGRRRTTHTND